MRRLQNLHAAHLTRAALDMVEKQLLAYSFPNEPSQENAEHLTFDDASFDHIYCQGVNHQITNTDNTIAKMARALKLDGLASISVYHRIQF